MAKVAIIGAGMAGLTAAERLLSKKPSLGVTLFDAHDVIGGRARTEDIGGEPIDWGCEALEAGDDSETTRALRAHGWGVDGPTERDPLFVKKGGSLTSKTFTTTIEFRSRNRAIMRQNVMAAARLYEDDAAHPARKPTYGGEDSIITGVDLSRKGVERIAALVSEYGGCFAESSLLGESSAYDRGRSHVLREEEIEDDGALPEAATHEEAEDDDADDDDGDDEEDEREQAGIRWHRSRGEYSNGPFFREGLGATVAAWAAAEVLNKSGLTQKLGWPVGEVRNVADDRVEVVHVNKVAVMTFDAAIITVPTPVIASGALAVKGMSSAQRQAFRDCPLGPYHKIAVTGVGEIEALRTNRRVYVCDEDLDYTFLVTSSPKGNYYMAHVAGPAGKKCNEDQAWAESAFLEMLEVLRGGTIARRGLRFYHSDWHTDERFGGAYSYSKAGKGGARVILSDLTIDRITFAGEACSLAWYGSLEGAMQTGIAAADRVLEWLG